MEPEEWALGLILRKALFGEDLVVEEVARNGETGSHPGRKGKAAGL